MLTREEVEECKNARNILDRMIHDEDCAYSYDFSDIECITKAFDLLERLIENKGQKMKNAEKYAKQIAELIAEDTGCCTCTKFLAGLSQYDGSIVCDACAISGICNSPDKLKEWLLEEESRGHGNAQAPRDDSL